MSVGCHQAELRLFLTVFRLRFYGQVLQGPTVATNLWQELGPFIDGGPQNGFPLLQALPLAACLFDREMPGAAMWTI